MLVYWTMYALPAVYTLLLGTADPNTKRPRIGMAILMIVFAILVGLRTHVGTDWFNYIRTVNDLRYVGFLQTFGYKDPGFGLVTWLSIKIGLDIYGADIVCGAALMLGVARFCRRQPDAWLAVTAAVPYLIIVVGMGYTRQAAAIGFILIALGKFEDRRYVGFVGWMVAAMLFHGASAIVLVVVAAVIAWERKQLILPFAVAFLLVFIILLRHRATEFYSTYIQAEYSSSGAAIRLVMGAIPSAIFLLMRDRFIVDLRTKRLWTLFAAISLLLLVALPIFPSSTALDRLGLYFIPVQLFVFGRLPGAFGETTSGARIISYISILYYGAALFVWLFYASNAHDWLPYRFAPLTAATVQSDSGF